MSTHVSPGTEQALQQAVLDAVGSISAGESGANCVLVAYSGGRDSTVLLHATVAVLGAAHVVAVHVNHQLQPEADQWQQHTHAFAQTLGCRYLCATATPPAQHPAGGIESWARTVRRQALAKLAREYDASAILLAHHADDQVETLLLNWGRGAGLTGMSGMQPRSLLEGIALLRPLLATQSDDIAMYAEQFKLSWVEDGSNQSLALRRNRVRHEVLPLLDEVFPGFRGNVLRHAALVAVAAEGSGKDDQTPVGPRFDRGQYRAQSDHALDALLHRWLKSMGQRAPTQARTRHLREQLFRSDSAYAQCQHDGAWLLRYRDEIQWLAQLPAPVNDEVSFSWQGERDLALPGFDGVLVFREAVEGEPGLPSSCLESAPLCVTSLRMNAQMRMVPGGVNRRLRLLCQEKGIPSWDRQRLPMLSRGQDVLFAAAIGLNHGFAKNEGSGRWQIEWRRSGKA